MNVRSPTHHCGKKSVGVLSSNSNSRRKQSFAKSKQFPKPQSPQHLPNRGVESSLMFPKKVSLDLAGSLSIEKPKGGSTTSLKMLLQKTNRAGTPITSTLTFAKKPCGPLANKTLGSGYNSEKEA